MRTEAKVISAVCQNNDMSALLEENVGDLFDSHADVWDWIKHQYLQHNKVPDAETVVEEWSDVDLPEVTEPTKFYAEKLRNEYLINNIHGILEEEIGKDESGKDMLETLRNRFNSLAQRADIVRDVDATDYEDAKETLKQRKRLSEEMGGSPGLPTGIDAIDEAYPTGLAAGHYVVIIGWSGYGKSWFSALLAANIWQAGYSPMIVSLEMSPEQVRDRVYTILGNGRFSNRAMSRGDIDLDDFEAFAKDELDGKHPFHIIANQGFSEVSPQTVQAKIDQYRPDVVICDYQQLFSDGRRNSGNEVVKNRNISRDFKLMAIQNDIPVINLSQATQQDPSDVDDPPLIEQVAWSKGIKNDADLALAVHKDNDEPLMEVVARKTRHGPKFDFHLEWDLDSGTIEEKYGFISDDSTGHVGD